MLKCYKFSYYKLCYVQTLKLLCKLFLSWTIQSSDSNLSRILSWVILKVQSFLTYSKLSPIQRFVFFEAVSFEVQSFDVGLFEVQSVNRNEE
jgi:hypothetical protein